MTNIASSATVRVLSPPSSSRQPNSATVAMLATMASSMPPDNGSIIAAAEMLNSRVMEMPALAPGRAWMSRVAARMSLTAPQNTSGRSQRSLRPHASRPSATGR